MIQILGKPECPFCWKVRLALSEAALPYQSLAVDSTTPEGRETLARYSPQGTVPVMIDGPVTLWESSIMVEYAADLDGPGAPLRPGDAAAHARARSAQYYSDRIVGPSLRAVVFEKRNKPEHEWDAARIREGTDGWLACQDHLEKLLGEQAFFAGNGFSIAECALIPRFGLAERYGVGVTSRHPNLARWFAAMKARPSYAATMPETFAKSAAPLPRPVDKDRPFRGMVPPT